MIMYRSAVNKPSTKSRLVLMASTVTVLTVLTVTGCSSQDSTATNPTQIAGQVSEETFSASDLMFLQMMIPHHDQAVIMAGLASSRALNPQIMGIANQISASQNSEIQVMKSWLNSMGVMQMPGLDSMGAHAGHMDGVLTDSQMEALRQASGDKFDQLFAEFMIEHHLGAISMARDVLEQGEGTSQGDPAVKALAQEMISTQEEEIVLLKSMFGTSKTTALTNISPALSHVHDAVLSGDSLFIGTHSGLHQVDASTGNSELIGESNDDFMSLAGQPEKIMVASGHPGVGSSLSNPIGLVKSTNKGLTWESISLEGEVDFHALAINGDQIVGSDTRGPLLWSQDGGQNWTSGPTVEVISIVWFQDTVWITTPDQGLLNWNPGDMATVAVGLPTILLSTSPKGDAIWRVDADGSVHRSLDLQSWTQAGSVKEIEALAAEFDHAYAVIAQSIQLLSVNN